MAQVTSWDKLKLLLWKNWILQWNQKWQISLELFLPTLFILVLIYLRKILHVHSNPVTEYPPLEMTNLAVLEDALNEVKKTYEIFDKIGFKFGNSSTKVDLKYKLLYSPQNEYLDNIMLVATKTLNLTDGYEGCENAKVLEETLMANNYLAGIQFDGDWTNATNAYPEKFSYAVRFPSVLRTSFFGGLTWSTMILFPAYETKGPRNSVHADGGTPVGYLREGFLQVQHAVTMAFLKLASGNADLPEVLIQRYPYPQYITDPLLSGLEAILSLLILLSFIYSSVYLTKQITAEKEKQLKEVMKIMGLNNWIHWVAWFVKSFITWSASGVVTCTLLTVNWSDNEAVLEYSSWSALVFFLFIYITTSICFCFMMATFFSKANTAASVSGLIWFLTYVPYTIMSRSYGDLSLGKKLVWSLVSNTAMGFGFKVILKLESRGEGLQWSNFFEPVSVDDSLTMGYIVLMMMTSCVLYIGICLYIEQIFPGDFGVPRIWYFPFTKNFWCGNKEKNDVEDLVNGQAQRRDPDAFEVAPTGKHIGLQVKNLQKKFGKKMAVKGLSVSMYEDEITVLLGHNGAGKTTTISMLTGMYPPTAGTAIINSCDIRNNIDGARTSMGICPQHNVLFDDLSVANHLVFFGRLKGLKGNVLQREVDKYLKKIELEDKANVPSSKLSGGMKRKLSVCCALCGDTKVVLCDEPSSGMDPSARRQLWDLLQSEKIGRTVLLTTHFMDEADVLGDRIAIMCDGELKCHGTPFFLKKRYGSGYHLICVKRDNCNVAEVTSLLSQYIPELQPKSDIGAELTYQLSDSHSNLFEEMFSTLESKSDELNLEGYGVGITSLGEVFMKVGAENANVAELKGEEAKINGDEVEAVHTNHIFFENDHLLNGLKLCVNQWHAMLLKKFLYTCRSKFSLLLQNLMPIFFVAVAVWSDHTSTNFKDLDPMTFNLTQYPKAVTVLETETELEPDSFAAQVAEQYKTIVTSYGTDYSLKSTAADQSFSDYILDLGRTMQVRINSRYLSAATIANDTFTAWLNNQPFHTAPLTVNLIHNAMARVLLGSNAEVKVTNAPLPYTFDKKVQQLNQDIDASTGIATNVCICMCFVSAFYVLFIIKERESRSKLLQFVGGVRIWIFWLSQIAWDFLTYTITALITIIIIACFQKDGLSSFLELGRYFLVMCLFGCAVLPFTYVMGFFFTEPATAYARLTFINIFTGVVLPVIVNIMSLLDFLGIKHKADTLKRYLRLFPHFSLSMGLSKLSTNSAARKTCSQQLSIELPESLRCTLMPKCCSIGPYFDWKEPGILPEVVFLAVAAVVFTLILLISEWGLVNELIYRMRQMISKPPKPPANGGMDNDVDGEKRRILNMSNNELLTQNLVLDCVTKYYGNFLAVREISLCVKQKECFGLLGVNGAGKTSTFKMMTGDERITYGNAYIKGMALSHEMNTIYREIGYCPQFDALLDDLTGRELLKIFCLLRGIQKERVNQISENLAKSFGFTKHLDKQTKAYSGGNKRKLSTAIALIGSPSVIYLDEPTTGMDPAARRQLWNMLCGIRDTGKSIVLTSHSMEECEALCTRLAIMVNGEFKCIGSTQHLKNKFSKGLILKIKVKRDVEQLKRILNYVEDGDMVATQTLEQGILNVKNFVQRGFPQAVLQEEYQGILTFYIPLFSIRWSQIFGIMESNRETLNIEDYSISQTSLEEIFLEFAKHQREEIPPTRGRKSLLPCFG